MQSKYSVSGNQFFKKQILYYINIYKTYIYNIYYINIDKPSRKTQYLDDSPPWAVGRVQELLRELNQFPQPVHHGNFQLRASRASYL